MDPFTFVYIFVLTLNFIGSTRSISLHVVPGKKLSVHPVNGITRTGDKKDNVDSILNDGDIGNLKLFEQGVIIPDDKEKTLIDSHIINEVLAEKVGDRSIDLPTLEIQGEKIPLKNKEVINKTKEEVQIKSARIARLEKLAQENLEEINILKNESLKENEKVKQDMVNKSEEARLLEEIGRELQNSNSSTSNSEYYIMSAANHSKITPNLNSFVSMLDDKLQEKGASSDTGKTGKDGQLTASTVKPEKEKQTESKGYEVEKEKGNETKVDNIKQIEGKLEGFDKSDKPEHETQVDARLDKDRGEAPEAAKIKAPLFTQAKGEEKVGVTNQLEGKNETIAIEAKAEDTSQLNDKTIEDKIMEGTMMEAEILKSNHLKPNTKAKNKKVKILILDDDNPTLKKPEQHTYDAEERLPLYASHTHLNHDIKYEDPCTLVDTTNIMEAVPHFHNNCRPPPSLQSVNNVRPLNVPHRFHLRPMDVCCAGDPLSEMHRARHPIYPEYLKGYLRQKVRNRHLPSGVESIEEALQPQIHYHFNFMKDTNARNLGTEESLIKSSLSTDWSDRKRGSYVKNPDSSSGPLIEKFISFIKSPASNKRNTLTKSKYKKEDGSPWSQHVMAYKRSRTAQKNVKRNLVNKKNRKAKYAKL